MVAVAKAKKTTRIDDYRKSKEYKEVARKEKEADRQFLATIRGLKKAPYEEFREIIIKWLEGFFGAVRNLEDEMVKVVIEQKQFQQDLMDVLKKRTDKDQAEFKIIQQNADTFHNWLSDLAEMDLFSAVAIFRLYQKKRRLTAEELKALAAQYHLFPDENSQNKSFDFAMDLLGKVSGEQNTGKGVVHGNV